jgi:hypothetical protein
MTRERAPRAYRFGPLERRGIVGSFRLGQVLIVASACALAVVVVRLAPGAGGFLAALSLLGSAAFVSFAPIGARTVEEWAPVLANWLRARAAGADRFRSVQVSAGVEATIDGSRQRRALDLPHSLSGCELLSVGVADGHELGVLKDPRLGGYTAVLAARARSVGLLPTSEHERRLERWGRLLAGLARSGTPIRRVQVLERTAPCDADALAAYLDDARDPSVPIDHVALRSYGGLLEGATRVTQDHEILIAVQVDQRRAWARAGRDPALRSLPRDEQACLVLARELQAFAGRFDAVDVAVAGLLSPSQYATALHVPFDPYREHHPSSLPVNTDGFGPTAADTAWASYRSDGAIHRTYWVAQWPRLPVGPLFLTPLLLGVQAVRSVSVVFEPVPPDRSRRSVEAAITSDEADEELRERRGFRTTARRRRQQEATRRREEELSSGHEELRFAGYVGVTGHDDDELARACEEVEQAALQAHLDLRPLWGEQDAGFVNAALPVARGLRGAGPMGSWL